LHLETISTERLATEVAIAETSTHEDEVAGGPILRKKSPKSEEMIEIISNDGKETGKFPITAVEC
jgi:hypothetical protein